MQPSPQDPSTLTPSDKLAPAESEAASPPPTPEAIAETRMRPPQGAASDAETLLPRSGPSASAASQGSLRLPGYEVLGLLGKGGMGVVYKARQVGLNRFVALKMILHAEHAGSEERQRFKAEAEAVARLQHPHIVQVFEVGEHKGLPFFSLEFCGGGSLADKLDGTPLPPHEAARLVETLARAMHVAHQAGIIHRDLKPANVLLAEDGTPKITDFGLAKRLDVPGHTQTGAVMGTPSYMAPEQARGQSKDLGPAADTYAMGAILYDCLTGRPPFKAATVMDTMAHVVSEEPVPPRRLQLKTPRDLETVCLKCLEKIPARRYATAQELAEELASFRAGQPVKARPVTRPERLWKWARRRPAQAVALVMTMVTLVGLGMGGAVFAWQAEEGRRKEEGLRKEAEQKRKEADEHRHEVEKQKGIVDNQAGALKQKTRDLRAALDQVKQEADDLLQEQERTQKLLANTSILLANREWEAGNLLRVRELLEDVPPKLRRWEWGHLRRTIRGGYCTLYGHTGDVTSVCFSPDGQRLASGSEDHTVRVWDAATGKELLTFKGHTSPVFSVCFSPDGQHLASSNLEGTVKVWDAATGKELLTLKGHTSPVGSLCFSPDGKTLWSRDFVGGVKSWDLRTGKQLDHPGQAPRLTFSSGPRHPLAPVLALAEGDTIRLIDRNRSPGWNE